MPAQRYNFAEAYMTRNGSVGTKDPYIQNGYIDKYGDNLYVMKRPGTTIDTNIGVTAACQGAFYFNGSKYLVFNDILYVTASGGNTGTNGSAFTQPSVPGWAGRKAFGSCVFQNRIYVIGGQEAVTTADVWYSNDGVNWGAVAGAAPFNARAYPSVCSFNNKIWVIAGADQTAGTYNNDVWSSTDGNIWTQVTSAAAFSPRFDARVVPTNGGMYLFSGESPAPAPLNDVWFSVDGETWSQLLASAPWSKRHQCGACYFKNKIWLIGGADAGGAFLNEVWSSSDGINWTQTTSGAFASGRIDMAVTVYNNKMWVLGGQTLAGYVQDVYSSSDGITWTLVTSTPGFGVRSLAQAVVFPVPVTVNQYRYPTIYIMGGTSNGSTFLKDVWYGNINAQLQANYSLNPTTAGQPYQFTTFVNGTYLLIKNQSNLWVLSAGTLIPVVDVNYPAVTVPGIVVLNQYAYVLTPQGILFASAFNDATTWPATQFIAASYEDDPGVYLGKYLNYLAAFGQYTTQFFYDNANPAPGISVSPYTNANIRVGVAFAGSVQNIENTVIFIGQTSNRNYGVYVLDGMNPKRVSVSWVDRLINAQAPAGLTSTMVTAFNGHTFYIIKLVGTFYAIVYDFKFNQWFLWSGASNGNFPYTHSFTDFSTVFGDYWVGANQTGFTGRVFKVQDGIPTDNGTVFPMVIQTDKIDGDNLKRKFWGRLEIAADVSSAEILVEYTDDDYQTYNRWGLVNLNQMRPYINRGGSSRRRAFRISQTDGNAARLEAFILQYSEGES